MKNTQLLTSIIIPGYNEERNIASVIKDVKKLKSKFNLEIIVVDDGSKDKTAQVAKKAGADRVISYKKNKGKGGAFRVGIDAAKGDYIVQIDADHQFQPNEIPLFIKALTEGFDVVCGTRFDKGKVETGSVSQLNMFGNWLMSTVTAFFSGIRVTDIMAGFKGFTRDAAKQLNLVTQHFGYEAEVVVKACKLNLKVKEVPITYTKRTFGSSSVHAIKDGIRVSYTIAKMYLTFPGPPPGHGIVGKRFLTLLIPIWLIGVLPYLSFLTNKTFQVNTSFEIQYITAILLFFTTKQFTGSRFAALIASAFFALSQFTNLRFPLLAFNAYTPILFWFALTAVTTFFLQEKKKEFFRKAIFPGIFFNICLLLIQDQTLITIHWISFNLAIFVLLLAWYFWNSERKFALSALWSSAFIIIGIGTKSLFLSAIGTSLLVGVVTASFFLETISFRKIKSPLFAPSRIVRLVLLVVTLVTIFSIKIMRTYS
jgi:glycosyltransferase involved in cell wall biosynthesis